MSKTKGAKKEVLETEEMNEMFDLMEELEKFRLDDQKPFTLKGVRQLETQKWNQDGIKHKLA